MDFEEFDAKDQYHDDDTEAYSYTLADGSKAVVSRNTTTPDGSKGLWRIDHDSLDQTITYVPEDEVADHLRELGK